MSENVTATYRSLEGARQAMTALERAGIDSSRISLEGERPARAAAEHDTSRRDLRVTGQLGSRVLIGGVVGAAAGGLVGWLIGSLAFEGFPAMLATVIAGVIAGSVIGGALSGYGTPAMSEDWELTHQDEPPGQTRVRVTSDDSEELDRAAGLLRGKDAISVDRA
jgi:outer membrane lipoprotein SlyB